MSFFKKYTLALVAVLAGIIPATAQQNSDDGSSSGSVVRRSSSSDRSKRGEPDNAGVTERMQSFFTNNSDASLSEGDTQWMRVIYRQIDLDKDANAALYFPEEPVEGQENMFRIIMKLLAENRIPAYEYLDGREVFTDQYKVKVRDMLDRFHIIYTDAKGSTEKNPRFVIDEADVPSNEVLSYYIIERWNFDNRNNRLKPTVEAICPVLHRAGDFGGEAVRYPMFWIKFSDLRPWLAQQTIFVDDDNNLPTCTYDDFFNLTMYDGEIYKTRNLKNRSMMQMFPDPEDRKRAQDSIQARLDNFEAKLWTPTREELAEAREKREEMEAALAANDSTGLVAATAEKPTIRSTKRSTKRTSARGNKENTKETKYKVKKEPKKQSSSSSAVRSVRRRR